MKHPTLHTIRQMVHNFCKFRHPFFLNFSPVMLVPLSCDALLWFPYPPLFDWHWTSPSTPAFFYSHQRISGRKKILLQLNENSKVKINKEKKPINTSFNQRDEKESLQLLRSWQSRFGACLTSTLIESSLQCCTTTASSSLLSWKPPVRMLATSDKRDVAFMESSHLSMSLSLKAAFTWQHFLIQYKHDLPEADHTAIL